MKIKQHIPNTLTCLNLLCGSAGLVFAFDGRLHLAALLVIAAALFDFLDGFSARLLKAYSAMGKELDSLADLVSFGLVPSVIVFSYLNQHSPSWSPVILGYNILTFSAFLLTIFSALRLARFNIDERQSEEFIGLPTPANALFFISFPLILFFGNESSSLYLFFLSISNNFYIMAGITLLFSFLMVSPLPLFSLKFKSTAFGQNRIRYIFVLICVVVIILLRIYALPFIIIIYLLISLAIYISSFSENKTQKV